MEVVNGWDTLVVLQKCFNLSEKIHLQEAEVLPPTEELVSAE